MLCLLKCSPPAKKSKLEADDADKIAQLEEKLHILEQEKQAILKKTLMMKIQHQIDLDSAKKELGELIILMAPLVKIN